MSFFQPFLIVLPFITKTKPVLLKFALIFFIFFTNPDSRSIIVLIMEIYERKNDISSFEQCNIFDYIFWEYSKDLRFPKFLKSNVSQNFENILTKKLHADFKGPLARILHAKARSRLLTSRRNAAIPPRSRVQCRHSPSL